MCSFEKDNYSCCWGWCSLTVGTWILGVLNLADMILSMLYGPKIQAIGETMLIIPFILTLFDRHSVLYRKILYYAYLIGFFCYLVAAFVFIILVAIWPDWMAEKARNACRDDETIKDLFDVSVSDCESKMKKLLTFAASFALFVGTPINAFCLRMLFYGWKEQE